MHDVQQEQAIDLPLRDRTGGRTAEPDRNQLDVLLLKTGAVKDRLENGNGAGGQAGYADFLALQIGDAAHCAARRYGDLPNEFRQMVIVKLDW